MVKENFDIKIESGFPTTKEIQYLEKKHKGRLIGMSSNLKNRTVTLTFERV